MFITNDELKNQLPLNLIPDYLGGTHKINHQGWLSECNKLITNRCSTSGAYYFSNRNKDNGEQFLADSSSSSNSSSKKLEGNSNSNRKRPIGGDQSDLVEEIQQAKKQISDSLNTQQIKQQVQIDPSCFQSLHTSFDNSTNGMRIDEVFEHVIRTGPYGLNEEFKSLKAMSFTSFDEFK